MPARSAESALHRVRMGRPNSVKGYQRMSCTTVIVCVATGKLWVP